MLFYHTSRRLFFYLFLFFLIHGIKALVEQNKNYNYPISVIVIVINLWGSIMFLYSFLSMEGYIIQLDGTHVWMNDEIGPKYLRTQFKADFLLKDIREIKFVITNANSRGRTMKPPSCFAFKKHLVFMKTNGREVRMNVSNFTKSYLAKILAEIINRIYKTPNCYDGKTIQEIMSKEPVIR